MLAQVRVSKTSFMKRSYFTYLVAVAVLVATGLLWSCNKSDNGSDAEEDDSTVAGDHAMLEKTYSDALTISDEAQETGSVSTYRVLPVILGGCATVTRDTVSATRVITIDFGSSDCLCSDSVFRRGKIIVTYTGKYKDSGYAHTLTFDKYFVNDNEVKGTKTVTNMGRNALGQPYYNILVNGSIVLDSAKGTISWNSTRVRTWTKGYSTALWLDDEYSLTGSGVLTRASGRSYNINITTPLEASLDCRWIRKGVIEFVPSGSGVARTLNYGPGTCDRLAAYTIGRKTYTIILR